MRGKFITFEGGEGVGKSTQVRLLADRLMKDHQVRSFVTREPGGSPGAEALRHVVLSGAAEDLGPFAEAVLFNAARNDHVNQIIEPHLEDGDYVLCDRFMDSTRVYQGVSGNLDVSMVDALESLAVGDTIPDLTLVLDIDAETAMKRAEARRGEGVADRFEKEELRLQQLRRQAFRDLAADNLLRCVLIDANKSQKEVAEDIWQIVSNRFFGEDDAMLTLDDAVTQLMDASEQVSSG